MNIYVIINIKLDSMPKYNFAAKSFETRQEQATLPIQTFDNICWGFSIIISGKSIITK